MPDFILNTPARRKPLYDILDDFAKGYIEAMFFTNGDTGDDNENLLNDLGVERLTKSAILAIRKTCQEFMETIMPDGRSVRLHIDELAELSPGRYGNGAIDDQRAGHFFWYARQGHGAGWIHIR